MIFAGYNARVHAVKRSNLIAYFPCNETTGTTVKDHSGVVTSADVVGATLDDTSGPDGQATPLFDGANDAIKIGQNAAFLSAFDDEEGAYAFWVKVDSDSWTDSSNEYWIAMAQADKASDRIRVVQDLTDHHFACQHRGDNSTVHTVEHTFAPTKTDFFHVVFTWSKANGELFLYIDGIQEDSFSGTLQSWTASADANSCNLGARDSSGGSGTIGNIQHFACWDTPISATDAELLGKI